MEESDKVKKENGLDIGIFAKIQEGIKNFSKQQKKLCIYLNDHYRDAAFMTIGQLSDLLEIGSATVMRTVQKLGYDSYKDFTGVLRALLIEQPSPSYWPELRRSWEKGDRKNIDNSLMDITSENMAYLENSITPSLIETFEKSVTLLKQAKRISILGLRSSRTLSYYFYFLMNQFCDHVELADVMGSEEIYSNLVNLNKNDVFFAISLGGPSYASRTHEAISYVHGNGVPIILLTEDLRNPSVQYAETILTVSSPPGHYSLLPAMNILDALIANLGSQNNEKTRKKMEKRMEAMSRILVEKKIIM